MEGSVEDSDVILYICTSPVRPVGSQHFTSLCQVTPVTGSPSIFHLPNWTLTAFLLLSSFVASYSAAVEHRVHLVHIWFVVHHPALDFYPGMSLEWHLLRTDHQLRGDSEFLEQAGGCRRPLQAERFLPVPDARHVHGRADLLDGWRAWQIFLHRIVPHLFVKC